MGVLTVEFIRNLNLPLTNEVLGVLTSVTSPLGLFYTNSNFETPDIDPDNVSGLGKYKNLPMQLDNNGDFLCGTYTFVYHIIQYDPKSIVSFTIVGINQAMKTFVVTGDAHAITGSYFVNGGSLNDGGYTVVSAVYDGVLNTTITVNESIPSAVVGGGVFNNYPTPLAEYTWDGTGGTVELPDLKFSDFLCFTLPKIRLDLEVLCSASKLSATDITDYRITNNGAVIDAVSIDRTYTYKYPTDLPTLLPDIVHSSAGVTDFITPIYTHTYKVTLESLVNYTLSNISSLHLDLIGSDTEDVECSLCICQLYNCIVKLVLEWRSFLGTDAQRAAEYWAKIQGVLIYKMLWDAAERCGNTHDMEKWCDKIEDIVVDANCTCDIDNTVPVLIIPVTGLSIPSTGGSHILFGSGVPAIGLGSNGDMYTNIITGFVYWKVTGAWLYQYATLGLPGLPGSQIIPLAVAPTTQGINGDICILTVAPYTIYYKTGGAWVSKFDLMGSYILYNPICNTGTDASTLEKILETKTLLAGQFAKDGDAITLKACFTLLQNDDTKTIRVYVDGTPVYEYVIMGAALNDLNDRFEINIDFDRTSATTLEVSYTTFQKSLIPDWGCNVASVTTTNLNLAHTIKVTGQCVTSVGGAGTINDIILKKFKLFFQKS